MDAKVQGNESFQKGDDKCRKAHPLRNIGVHHSLCPGAKDNKKKYDANAQYAGIWQGIEMKVGPKIDNAK